MEDVKRYTVFISYRWTTPQHEKWVLDLAERLMEHGVDVKLDKWDLKVGQDKFRFMESMVCDKNIDRVLIICDKGYKEKADNREGGVGTETQIITPEIYKEVNQEKFIPIIAEKGEMFSSYLPIYLQTRIAIDMSSDEVYEKGYEQLIRLIYERPVNRKPALGQAPAFLFEDEKPHFKTTSLVKQLKYFLMNKPEQSNYVISEFIEEFQNSLGEFRISHEDLKVPYDEQIYTHVCEMISLRNDYIEFLSLLCKLDKSFNIDMFICFFEDIYMFTEPEGSGTYRDYQFEHYKFFITELYLYTSIILIENNKFNELNNLLTARYFVKSKYNKQLTFSEFRFYISVFDEYRNRRLDLNRISITADLLIQRSTIDKKSYKEKLIETDLLLYYIAASRCGENYWEQWFPTTYIYNARNGEQIDILKRMISERYFEKIKCLFNVSTKEEMKDIINNSKACRGYNNSFHGIPSMQSHIDADEVCKYK